jgi:hypothetical protein
MKTSSAFIAAAVAMALPLGAAQAKTSPSAGKKPAAASSVAKGQKKSAAKPATAAKAKAAPAPVQPEALPLTTAQLAIAHHIHTGEIPCELGASVTVSADDKNPGFFTVMTGKLSYHMHPVESRTGAIRLEDDHAGALWLQLGNKSMLMDQKQGRRLADDCVTPQQRAVAAQLQSQPQPSLLDRR